MDDRDLIRAILAAPDDDEPRLVWADWLDERDDPERAEFVRVQCELARLPPGDPRASALEARAYRLLARGYEEWSEGLYYVGFRRGLIGELYWWHPLTFVDEEGLYERHPADDVEIGAQDEPGWGEEVAGCPHLAHVRTLRLTEMRSHFTAASDFVEILSSPHLTGMTALDASGGHRYGDEVLFGVLGLPSLAGLRTLSLSDLALTDAGVRALAESPLAATLTRLDLSNNGALTPEAIRALIDSPLWARLEALNLGSIRFADRAALELVVGALPRSRIRALGLKSARRDVAEILAGAPAWGELEALDLSWTQLTDDDVRLLTGCPHLAGLRQLKLEHVGLRQAAVRALADCAHLAGLTALDLGGTGVTDAGLAALAGSAYLTRLERLGLDTCPIGDAGVAAFAGSPNAGRLRAWDLPGSVGDAGLRALADSPHLGQLTALRFGGWSGERIDATEAGVSALIESSGLQNLAFVQRYWQELPEAGVQALLDCERLAWPGQFQSSSRRTRAFESGQYGPLFLLFPWSKYAFS